MKSVKETAEGSALGPKRGHRTDPPVSQTAWRHVRVTAIAQQSHISSRRSF